MKMRYSFLILFLWGFISGCTTYQEHEVTELIAFSRGKKNISVRQSEKPKKKKMDALQSFIEILLRENLAIKVARDKWYQAQTKYPQVVSLPDPTITYAHFMESVETRVGPQKYRISVMQMFPFPAKIYYKGKIANIEVAIARLAYFRTIRDQVALLQKNFYELLYIEKAINITKQNQKILMQFVKIATIENTKGKTPVSDLFKAQSQVAQMKYDLIRLEELKIIEMAKINALLDRPHGASISIKNNFPERKFLAPFETFYGFAKQKQQEILASKLAFLRSSYKQSLAVSEYFPDITVGFTWIGNDERENVILSDNGKDAWLLQFGINIPLWIPKYQARIKNAKLGERKAKNLAKNLENVLAVKLKEQYYNVKNALRLITLYEKNILPEAKKSMVMAENWYRDGKGSLLSSLEVQNTYLKFSLLLERARANYAKGMIEMSRLSGGMLPEITK